MGFIAYNAIAERDELKQENEDLKVRYAGAIVSESTASLERKYADLKEKIAEYLRVSGAADPDKVVDDLISVTKLEETLQDLQRRLEEAKFEAESCRAELAPNLASEPSAPLSKAELDAMMELLAQVRGEEAGSQSKRSKRSIMEAIGQLKQGQRELAVLRKKCGGGEIGPCWRKENGKTQNLFDIVLEQEVVRVSLSEMSRTFQSQSSDLPGVPSLINTEVPYSRFRESFGPILEWSKRQEPECRHYASIRSNVPLTKDSTPRRMKVQEYFFPDESSKQ